MASRQNVGVIATLNGRIVLVFEQFEAWPAPHWNIPSGRVEPGESPKSAALRELREETGLTASADDLVLVSACQTGTDAALSTSWNYAVHVDADELAFDDPDGSILDARWFEIDEAIELLKDLPYPPLSEPAVGYLEGRFELGTRWEYPAPHRVATTHPSPPA